jgi:hypothetical protein
MLVLTYSIAVLSLVRFWVRRGEPVTAIYTIDNCRESHVRRAFKIIFALLLPLGVSDIFIRDFILLDIVPIRGGGGIIVTKNLARRVRSNKRRDAGVGAGGGQSGSNAKARRSLDVDQRS